MRWKNPARADEAGTAGSDSRGHDERPRPATGHHHQSPGHDTPGHDSLAAGHHTGRYLAQCGQQGLTASLTTPEHSPCTNLRSATDAPVNPTGPDSEVLVWSGLRRVHAGGVVTRAGHWLDHGRAVPGQITATLDRLVLAGLITLADPVPDEDLARRASLTTAGHTRYAHLRTRHGKPSARAEPQTPDTSFPPDPGRAPVEPDVSAPGAASTTLPAPDRPHNLVPWARDDQGRSHAIEPADALLSTVRGHTLTRCGQIQLPADTTLDTEPSGSVCQPCVLGTLADRPDPSSWSL